MPSDRLTLSDVVARLQVTLVEGASWRRDTVVPLPAPDSPPDVTPYWLAERLPEFEEWYRQRGDAHRPRWEPYSVAARGGYVTQGQVARWLGKSSEWIAEQRQRGEFPPPNKMALKSTYEVPLWAEVRRSEIEGWYRCYVKGQGQANEAEQEKRQQEKRQRQKQWRQEWNARRDAEKERQWEQIAVLAEFLDRFGTIFETENDTR